VRHRAKEILQLVNNPDRLREERDKVSEREQGVGGALQLSNNYVSVAGATEGWSWSCCWCDRFGLGGQGTLLAKWLSVAHGLHQF
jgi:hypothetical protein